MLSWSWSFLFSLCDNTESRWSANYVCLSLIHWFSFVRDFEKAAYRLLPIASTYTKWEECLHYKSSVCLSDCYALLSVCLSSMLFHLRETLKKLPIAYCLSPPRIPSERNAFIFLLIEIKVLSVSLLCFVVCLSVLYTFSFARDFENVAYRLSPITSTYTKWVECLHFLVDWNKILSVWVLCFVVCLSVLYTFSFVRDFEKGAYRLSPITSTYTKWEEYAYKYSRVPVHAYT
jgi:hypothetical protein